jgi:hypothetical protein
VERLRPTHLQVVILGSIVVGSAGVENKIKGVPDNRLALSFLAHRSFCRIASTPRSAAASQLLD